MNLGIRPVMRTDIDDIARLADNLAVAEMTAALPHPYAREHAITWLEYLEKNEREHVFAVCGDKKFMGVVGLIHETEHKRTELGYWLGKEFWNNGYMSVAVSMALAYAFSMLGVNRVYAFCFDTNAASKKVLEKNGFVPEGCLKKHFIRLGKARDVLCYGLLK